MNRVYRTPESIITSSTKKGALELAGKEKLTYLGNSRPLDEETREKLGIKRATRVEVVNTKLERKLAGAQIKVGRNQLLLLNNYPRPAPKSTLYHEVEHTLQPHKEPKTPRELARQEIAVEVAIYQKTGIPLRNRMTLRGLRTDLVEKFDVSTKEAKGIILKELKRQKAPIRWIRDFRGISSND